MSGTNHDAPDRQPSDAREQQPQPQPQPQQSPVEPTQQPDHAGEQPASKREPRQANRHVALLTSGLSLYLIVLWFGITIVGDTIVRSALMAALIVAIAGTGFVYSRRSVSSEE